MSSTIQHGSQDNSRGAANDDRPRLELVCADKLQAKPINWLWPGWLAAGKFHLLAGRAGTGKTTLALEMAAIVSTGGTWPDGTTSQAGDVVFWSGEDGVADTLVPRLSARGADMRRIKFVGAVSNSRGSRPFSLAIDGRLLAETLRALANPKLVLIDPVIVAITGDTNKGGDVRRGLQPLADLAETLGVAVLGITHFNKGMSGVDPLDRVTGSLAFGAVARIVMGAAGPKESGGERRLVRLKSNVGADDGGFAFNLVQTPVPDIPNMKAQTVVWSEPLTGSGRELLAEVEGVPPDAEPLELLGAKDWLSDKLIFGSMTVKQLQIDAQAAGHAWRTIERAKRALGVKSTRTAPDGGWEWKLPADPFTSGESEDRQ